MENFMLNDEKATISIKPSILGEHSFWVGVMLLIISIVIFALMGIFIPSYDISFARVFALVGMGAPLLIGPLPLIPSILEIVALLYILYAEFTVYFKHYMVTNYRVILRRGIIAKDTNIILPAKISDVSVDISILDRMLKLGKILIRPEEASRPVITLYGVRDPYKFQDAILKLVDQKTYQKPDGTVQS